METKEIQLVTLAKIEAIYQKNPKKSLEKLIKTMKELDQGRAHKSDVDVALSTPECGKCHSVLKKGEEDGSTCPNCLREEREQKREEELLSKWRELCKALNSHRIADKKEGEYELRVDEKIVDNTTIVRKLADGNYINIYRAVIYHGKGFYSNRSYALRIGTSKPFIRADKLRVDFKKGLAKRLHEKAEELFDKIAMNEERVLKCRAEEEQKEKASEALTEKISNLLIKKAGMDPNEISIRDYSWRGYIYGDHDSHRNVRPFLGTKYDPERKVFDLKFIKNISTRDTKIFEVSGIKCKFNLEQLLYLHSIVEGLNKKNEGSKKK